MEARRLFEPYASMFPKPVYPMQLVQLETMISSSRKVKLSSKRECQLEHIL
jgi:hypothetical protein